MACIQDRGERVSEIREIKEMLNENLTKMFKSLETELYNKLDKAVEGKIKEMITRQDSFEQRFEKAEKKSTENENKYEQRFKLIEQKLSEKNKNSNPEKLENMIKDVKETEINIESKIKNQVGIYLDNKEVKEKKKMNLIIHRLKESEEKEEDQKVKDKEDIKKKIEFTNQELLSEFDSIIKDDKNITSTKINLSESFCKIKK